MPICQSTKEITGCGLTKNDEDFQRTKNGRMKVCQECLLEHRDRTVVIKRKPKPNAETELYNQFDRLMR